MCRDYSREAHICFSWYPPCSATAGGLLEKGKGVSTLNNVADPKCCTWADGTPGPLFLQVNPYHAALVQASLHLQTRQETTVFVNISGDHCKNWQPASPCWATSHGQCHQDSHEILWTDLQWQREGKRKTDSYPTRHPK